MTHTLASISADLITNSLPRHFGASAEDLSNAGQFPNHYCWFLDDHSDIKRAIWFYNPGLKTPAAEIAFRFFLVRGEWRLVSSVITSHEPFMDKCVSDTKDFEHTTIAHALRTLQFIDD